MATTGGAAASDDEDEEETVPLLIPAATANRIERPQEDKQIAKLVFLTCKLCFRCCDDRATRATRTHAIKTEAQALLAVRLLS